MSTPKRNATKGRHELLAAAIRLIEQHATAIEALCQGQHIGAKDRTEIRRRCAQIVEAAERHEALDRP